MWVVGEIYMCEGADQCFLGRAFQKSGLTVNIDTLVDVSLEYVRLWIMSHDLAANRFSRATYTSISRAPTMRNLISE